MASPKPQPPTTNEGWRRGDGGQWRLDPVPHKRWAFWREGIHFIFGIGVGLWLLAGIIAGVPLLPLVGLQAIVTVLFLAYEITEGWRIRDWAYRDIGGYMAGYFVAVTAQLPAVTLS